LISIVGIGKVENIYYVKIEIIRANQNSVLFVIL